MSRQSTTVRAGATADLAPCHLAADVVLRAVGVKRDVGPIEGDQQFGLVGVQPGKRAVEGREAGLAAEDTIEAGLKANYVCPLNNSLHVVLKLSVRLPTLCNS